MSVSRRIINLGRLVFGGHKRKAALANFIFGQSQNIFIIFNGIVLLPIYLKHISFELYGIWLATGNIITWISVIESGLAMVLTQRLARNFGLGRMDRFAQIAVTGCVISLIMAAAIALIGAILSIYVASWFSVTDPVEARDLTNAIALAAIAGGIATIVSVIGALPQACLLTFGMGIVNLAATLAGLVVTVLALESNFGLTGLAYGLLARSGLQIVGLSLVNYRHWRILKLPSPTWSNEDAVDLMGDALPMFFARLTRSLGENSIAVISASIISPLAAATLVITGRLVLAIRMIVGLISSATFGGLASSFGEGDTVEIAKTFVRINWIVSSLVAIGMGLAVAINESLVSVWIGSDKYGGLLINVLIVLAGIVEVLVISNTNLLQAIGRFRSTAWLELMGVSLRLALMFLLGWYYGVGGIVFGGIVASVIVNGVLLSGVIARAFNIPPEDALRMMAGNFPAIVLCFLLGSILSVLVDPFRTWLELSAFAFLYTSMFSAIAFTSPKRLGSRVKAVLVSFFRPR